jgi:hypothetical protein
VRRASGQATVESVALVLLLALVLGAAVAEVSSRAESDRGLGPTLAKQIANAPRRASSFTVPGPAAPTRGAPTAEAPAHVPERRRATSPERRASGRPLRSRAVDAFRRLRGVTTIARRAWIVCLGYRRWREELAHPRAPTQALPLRDALAIANECLNPYAFLLEG